MTYSSKLIPTPAGELYPKNGKERSLV